jgi:hypothetical protein
VRRKIFLPIRLAFVFAPAQEPGRKAARAVFPLLDPGQSTADTAVRGQDYGLVIPAKADIKG